MTKNTNSRQKFNKPRRQNLLLEIVRDHKVSTQTELAELLMSKGVSCTQVSVSRDIRELGLVKRGGRYHVPSEAIPARHISEMAGRVSGFIRAMDLVGDNMVVIRTLAGTAHSVSAYIDGEAWTEVAGTVAGDDTIFVAVWSAAKGQALMDRLNATIAGQQ